MTKPIAKSFSARLEHIGSRLGWIIIRIPLDVPKIWGVRGRLKVRGEINGFAFRTSLFPTGNGKHVLLVNKRMQAGAKAALGAVARFRLEPDTEERVLTVPVELMHALAEERSLRQWFDQLNFSTRKWLTDWVTAVKSKDTRKRRAEQMGERLLSTMEAERELPPVLKMAFARNPQAREGWDRMSLLRRRMHLLGIFSCRSPNARARRIAKALQDAAKFAQREK